HDRAGPHRALRRHLPGRRAGARGGLRRPRDRAAQESLSRGGAPALPQLARLPRAPVRRDGPRQSARIGFPRGPRSRPSHDPGRHGCRLARAARLRGRLLHLDPVPAMSQPREPTERIYLPKATPYPAVFALGLAAVIVGLYAWWPYSVIGGFAALFSLIAWLRT